MPTKAKPKKKVQITKGTQEAISEFKEWLAENPDADLQRRVNTFDAYIDRVRNGY